MPNLAPQQETNTMKHTWNIDPTTGSIDQDGTPIAFMVGEWYGEKNDVHNNARLIAAAPEMLAAMKLANDYASNPDMWLDKVYKAISKAKGE
jgi:hypothetical protein